MQLWPYQLVHYITLPSLWCSAANPRRTLSSSLISIPQLSSYPPPAVFIPTRQRPASLPSSRARVQKLRLRAPFRFFLLLAFSAFGHIVDSSSRAQFRSHSAGTGTRPLVLDVFCLRHCSYGESSESRSMRGYVLRTHYKVFPFLLSSCCVQAPHAALAARL